MVLGAPRTQHLETRPLTLPRLPSIERLLQSEGGASLIDAFGRPLTVDALRNELAAARLLVRKGNPAPSTETLLAEARRNLGARLAPSISPVINATGVILHTNLGRAPLSPAACEAMLCFAGGYSTLEFDLSLGRRGDRSKHAEAQVLL